MTVGELKKTLETAWVVASVYVDYDMDHYNSLLALKGGWDGE